MTARKHQHIYGKDIVRKFYPLEGDDPVHLPSQSLGLFLYENQPSIQDARTGVGSLQEGATIAINSVTPYDFTYSFTAINDTDETTGSNSKLFWEAINFVAQELGETQTILRTIKLARVEQLEAVPGTTVEDVKDVFPKISNYVNDADIEDYIVVVEQEIKIELASKGILWQRVYDLQELKLAIAFKVIAHGAIGSMLQQNDRHHIRYNEYKGLAKDMMAQVTLLYDRSKSGQPTETVKVKADYMVARR